MMKSVDVTDDRANQLVLRKWMVPCAVALLIAAVYWPVRHGGFVWDDIINFVENDWLSRGSQWRRYVLRDFNGWINYFRPFGVALFTLQVRIFDSQPGPMHLVSLGMHLVNTGLVGVVAVQVMTALGQVSRSARVSWLAACMVLYGLHPALIETVAWVGTQFDLLATGFMLLGTYAALALSLRPLRAFAVGACYFFAFCSKESAAIFPMIVLLVDWIVFARSSTGADMSLLRRNFIQRNSPVFIALLIAGAAYLLFRYYGLGYLVQPVPTYGGELSFLGTIQKFSMTYLSYVKILVYPWTGLNPIHSFDATYFEIPRAHLLLWLLVFGCLTSWALLTTYKRASTTGCLVIVVTSALLPVLNIAPVGFAPSLYHERYIINALALGVVFLPVLPWPTLHAVSPSTRRHLLIIVTAAWMVVSSLTIRSILPIWMEDERVWRWAVANNPTSEISQYNFVAALIRNDKIEEADRAVDSFSEFGPACTRCDIQVAIVQLDLGNIKRAELLLRRIGKSVDVSKDLDVRGDYLLTAGHLEFAYENYVGAADLLARGIELQPERLAAHVNLAEALLHLGKYDQALSAANSAAEIADAQNRELIATWRDGIQQRLRHDGSE